MVARRSTGVPIRGLGQGDTPVVTSRIVDPTDPAFINVYTDVGAGGASYTGTGANGGRGAGSTAGSTNGSGGGAGGTSAQPTTGIGPFAGSAGGSGFGPGPGLNLPNLCSAVFGQWLCTNGIWLLLGGGVALFLLLADSGRRR